MIEQNIFDRLAEAQSPSDNTITIAISIYDPTGSYARHVGVTLASIFANTRNPICAYVLTDETLNLENRKKLITIAERFNQNIIFIDVILPNDWQNINTGQLYTKAILYRLLLPDLLQEHRVIYLDCDIIVDMDIQKLWNIPLHGQPLAAAKDQGIRKLHKDLQQKVHSLGVSLDTYFNSGVLVFDLDKIRDEYHLVTKFNEFLCLNANSILLDQDFLNWLFHESYEQLHPSFNILVGYAESRYFLKGQQILHFTPIKSWKMPFCGIGLEYWKYVKLTPWANDAIDYIYQMGLNEKERGNRLQSDIKQLQAQQTSFVSTIFDTALQERYKELTKFIGHATNWGVVRGPFSGMRLPFYPTLTNLDACSKLLGTYKEELHPIIQSLPFCKIPHRLILDIGSTDGYYTVGLARIMPWVDFINVSFSKNAAICCHSLAKINGVESRIQIKEKCTPSSLLDILSQYNLYETRCLLHVDVEGSEVELLDTSTSPLLTSCDLLIECHDYYQENTTQILTRRFQSSHEIQTIHQSGRNPTEFSFLHHRPDYERWLSVSEGRSGSVTWLWCRAKHDPAVQIL